MANVSSSFLERYVKGNATRVYQALTISLSIVALLLATNLSNGSFAVWLLAILAALTAVITWRTDNAQPVRAGLAAGAMLLAVVNVIVSSFVSPGAYLAPVQLLLLTLILGLALYLTASGHPSLRRPQQATVSQTTHQYYLKSAILAGIGFLLLITSGTLVSGTNSGGSCPDWPLCWGEIFPENLTLAVGIVLLHRFTVVFIAVLVAAVILQTRRNYSNHSMLNRWATILGVLFVIQILMGGLYAMPSLPYEAIKLTHQLLTAAAWGALVILGTIGFYTTATVEPAPPPVSVKMSVREKLLTYFKLTKPWVMILLLLTTLTAMIIAAEGIPALQLMLYTLLGGILSAGGASVLNSYIDSDIDQVMSRTSRRATVTGVVTPQETLVLGLALSALSFMIFALFVNTLSAVLSTLGIIYYVFFYTLYLKRTTIHNIIIGGAAGAIPPLVGWTAVTGSLNLGALYLFAIIFFWTPPHTWALAMMVKKDYSRAGVPMLPVVAGEKETSYQIWLYSLLLIPLTLLPFSFNMVSWVYLLLAAVLGIRFLSLAWRLWQDHTNKSLSRKLYKYSQSYLALLFLIMAVDRTLF
jgi:protoheme IX farnesyltransferase